MKGSVGWFHLVVLFVGISCLVYWGNGNHLAVEVPVVDSSIIQQLKAKLDAAQIHIKELQFKRAELEVKLKSSKYVIAQYERQLKDLKDSVPPQPVILKALHDESKTPAGFKAAVTRNFGSEIAGRIRVVE